MTVDTLVKVNEYGELGRIEKRDTPFNCFNCFCAFQYHEMERHIWFKGIAWQKDAREEAGIDWAVTDIREKFRVRYFSRLKEISEAIEKKGCNTMCVGPRYCFFSRQEIRSLLGEYSNLGL